MKAFEGTPARLRLSIQADQVDSPVGGGRFLRGFLAALFADPEVLAQFERIYIIATQNESIECIDSIPSNVTLLWRRYPSRLRNMPFERLFGYTLPSVDVSFGPFFHSFPSRARVRVITVHDLSCFEEQYHPLAVGRRTVAQLNRMVNECDGIVCISRATMHDFQKRWPQHTHKATVIYNGVSSYDIQISKPQPIREHTILAVGTIEPRKNYSFLLDAFERLVNEQGKLAPLLIVVGSKGWMSEGVERRLSALHAAGRCRWLEDASDEELADAYSRAGVFTYLSSSEGFGYPPFEAAFARCPMVLSNSSSVGEIWSGYAKCVDPQNLEEIVNGWKWALSLKGQHREHVVACQEKRAREFTWSCKVREYIEFWNGLLSATP